LTDVVAHAIIRQISLADGRGL